MHIKIKNKKWYCQEFSKSESIVLRQNKEWMIYFVHARSAVFPHFSMNVYWPLI